MHKELRAIAEKGFVAKLRAGGVYDTVTVTNQNGRMFFDFGYNKDLITEIKTSFEGRKWHGFEDPPRMQWSAPITQRNLFTLAYLLGKYCRPQPMDHWKKPIPAETRQLILDHCERRKLTPYEHQIKMVEFALTKRHCEWAARMGLGKTLAAIITMEMLPIDWQHDAWWIGPKTPLHGVRLEFDHWRSRVAPEFMTYDKLRTLVKQWRDGAPAPRILVVDEASRAKNPKADRTQAIMHVTNAMRDAYGTDCLILLLTGTPAPKTPADWWSQVEICCPGFLREKDVSTFRNRLGLIEIVDGPMGKFPKLVTWFDDQYKCRECGEFPEHVAHHGIPVDNIAPHGWVKSVNEVERLGKHLAPIVLSLSKEDCLSLPEKQFKRYEVEPTQEVLQAARLIMQTTPRAPDALIKLRTLSDGFLYQDKETGEKIACPGCKGVGTQKVWYDKNTDLPISEEAAINGYEVYASEDVDENGDPISYDRVDVDPTERDDVCATCFGDCEVPKLERVLVECECPKDDVLKELLNLHESDGRFVVYGGFQGTITRVVRICHELGWDTIKVDGRGWEYRSAKDGSQITMSEEDMLREFQHGTKAKICFVGQPSSAGMGITLTASRGVFFFSNDFNPESRDQSTDRVHRIGMSENGGWVYDVIHLASDLKILDSLEQSFDLQRVTMTSIKECFDADTGTNVGVPDNGTVEAG